jgi:serine phosphatase RsbU (regulator of sigma subunit)/anti-sigma regulatory factor (Ser/Thr protein kinase)/anti-anti-sigma regulatory factor
MMPPLDPDPAPAEADDRLRRLQRVTDAALAHLSVDKLLAEMLERVQELLAVDTVAVLLLDSAAEQLVATAARGIEAEVRQGVRIPLGHGFAGRVAAERQPVLVPSVDRTTVLNPILWEHGIKSLLGVPLLAGGAVLGVLHVGALVERRFSDEDVQLLQVVAERLASALGLRQAEVERAATALLQRSLLPSRLPEVPGLTMAARYVPAEGGRFGGDWYDVFQLPGGGLCVAIGDVVGRGFAAAEVMGRLRNALRAHVLFSDDPAEALTRLNQHVRQFDTARMIATVQVAILDPSLTHVRLSSAGHLPPVLAAPDTAPCPVQTHRDPPIGVAEPRPRRSITFEFPLGAALCLYTDGLVERPYSPLDANLTQLCEALVPDAPETVCRTVMSRLIGDQPSPDDVAILVLRREDPAETAPVVLEPPTRTATEFHANLRLTAGPRELAAVRDRFIDWLGRFCADRTVRDELVIALGEATANAYDHSGALPGPDRPAAWVHAVCRDGRVHVTVGDTGVWRPPSESTGNRGRGRTLMAALTDRVEMRTDAEGTVVELWRELPRMTTQAGVAGPERADDRLRLTWISPAEVVAIGEIDLSTAPQFREVLKEADTAVALLVDLRQVDVLQSAGLVELFDRAAAGPLTLVVRPGSAIATVLDVTGIGDVARVEVGSA